MKAITRKGLLVLVGILIAGGIFWAIVESLSGQAFHDEIPTYVVKRQPFKVTIKAIGTLEAISSKAITAPFNGKIVKLVPEGTFVKKGDPVIWFDTTDLEQDKQNLETEIKLAESRVNQLEDELRLLEKKQQMAIKSQQEKIKYQEVVYRDAQLNYETEKKLVERSLTPRSHLDEAKLALLQAELALKQEKINLTKMLESNKSQLVSKKAEIEKAKIELEHKKNKMAQTMRKLEKAILKAPGSGYVIYLPIWKGGRMEKPAEGDQVYTRFTLAQIPDSSTMLATVPVNEIDIDQVKPGMKAVVRVESIPDKLYPAEVTSKSIVPVTESSLRSLFGGTQTAAKEFEVKAKILENDERFRPGMTATVDIIVADRKDACVVPLVAIKEEDGKKFVFLKEPNSYRKVEVKVGLVSDTYAEILSGVKEGDEIYLRDPEERIEKLGLLEKVKAGRQGQNIPLQSAK